MSGTHHYPKDHFLHPILNLELFFPLSFLHVTASLVFLPHYFSSPAHAWQISGVVDIRWYLGWDTFHGSAVPIPSPGKVLELFKGPLSAVGQEETHGAMLCAVVHRNILQTPRLSNPAFSAPFMC